MHRRNSLLLLITAFIGLAASYLAYTAFNASGLPLAVQVVDAHAALLVPVPGLALPKGLHVGEPIDLTQQPPATRIAIAQLHTAGQLLPAGRVYYFTVHRGGTLMSVPVASTSWGSAPGFRLIAWLRLFEGLFSGAIALIAVWRGRDRAAAGLALFAITFLAALATISTPLHGTPGLLAMLGAWTLFLLGRVGFYVMAESMAGAAFSAGGYVRWRVGLLVLLSAGAVLSMGGPIIYVVTGWAELLQPKYGPILTMSYLVPVALLFLSYQRADTSQRVRLSWMRWSSALFVVGIAASNTQVLGPAATRIATSITIASALAGFLYAILRHRVVDIRVVISRTLVYAMTTSLVLGLFALFESLIERVALGRGASLILELAVPLGLGASLSSVHQRIDDAVDRLIFRRQYREELALRRFATESAFVTQPETLLDLAVDQISQHVGAPWVALYEASADGCTRVRHRGMQDPPDRVDIDDLALVKLRAQEREVDLHEAPSGLGGDGYAFPLRARGDLLGVLVVGPRPGEHYGTDERDLIAHVAHAVGMSLFALRAQATEERLQVVQDHLGQTLAELESRAAALDQAHARARATEALLNDARARESALLDALHVLGDAQKA